MPKFRMQLYIMNILSVQRELPKGREGIPRFCITISFIMPTSEKSVMGH